MGKSWEMMGNVARIIEEKKWLAKSWENGGKNWRENGRKIAGKLWENCGKNCEKIAGKLRENCGKIRKWGSRKRVEGMAGKKRIKVA
jgi:hypothetical protein